MLVQPALHSESDQIEGTVNSPRLGGEVAARESRRFGWRGRHGAVAPFVASFAVFAVLSVLWALASPVFSVPDENAHATKAIAQVRGQIIGYTVPDVRHIVVDLPPGYYYSPELLCFTARSDIPASCGAELGEPDGQPWFNTWVGAYNPIYYYLVGWPSLFFDGNAGIYAMRIASALLGSALLAWAFQVAVLGPRARWMPLGIAFAAAPMNVYLVGAVNPNGAELAAAVAVWVGVLRLIEPPASPARGPLLRRTWIWGGVAIASIVLANARALGPLWLLIIVGLCFVGGGWRMTRTFLTTRANYPWLAVISAGVAFSVGWTVLGGSLSGQAEASDAPLVNGTFWQGFVHMIRHTNDFLQQAIGFFGWVDTPLPPWAYWFVTAAWALLVGLALTATRRRSIMTLCAILATSGLVPALVQGYSVQQTGIIWQGRYGLFIYLGVTIVASWLLSRDAPRVGFLAPRITWLAASLLAAYGVVAFALVLVRYVVGGEADFGEMFTNPRWQPPFGWLPLVMGYALGSSALVALVGRTATGLVRRESSAAGMGGTSSATSNTSERAHA